MGPYLQNPRVSVVVWALKFIKYPRRKAEGLEEACHGLQEGTAQLTIQGDRLNGLPTLKSL